MNSTPQLAEQNVTVATTQVDPNSQLGIMATGADQMAELIGALHPLGWIVIAALIAGPFTGFLDSNRPEDEEQV